MTLIGLLSLLVLGLILAVLWQLAGDVRRLLTEALPEIRATLQKISSPQERWGWPTGRTSFHPGGAHLVMPPLGCFVVWVWNHGEWHPQAVPYGIRPGTPPPYTGAFSGEVAKTWVTTNPA